MAREVVTLAAAAVCVRRGDWMPWLFVILLTTPIGPIVYLVVVFGGLQARSLAERRQIASDLRQLSATEIATKSDYIMDVNQHAVERAMRNHGVSLLLHGHTHRPAVHRFTLDGREAARIVLGAWYHEPSIVRWTAAGYELESLAA